MDDVKPELIVEETEEEDPKRAKLLHRESPANVVVKPDKGTAQLVEFFVSTVGICVK